MTNLFCGKKITVMGLGLHGGGVGAVKFLLKERAGDIIVTDLKPKALLLPSIRKLPQSARLRYVLGEHRMSDFEGRDAVIKNPDVPSSSPYLAHALKNKIPVLSDVGIFFERVKTPIIGVTGTKGKSTTATLIAALLKKRFENVLLAGNIRKSVLDIIDRAKRADIVVLELSSFQLEDLGYARKSPRIAVVTSIFRDHINRHKTFNAYRRIKLSIGRFQIKSDAIVIPAGRGLELSFKRSAAKKIIVDISERRRKEITKLNPALAGHMADAALLALAAANKIFGVSVKDAEAALRRFKPLEGRMQTVAVKWGVTFINDTTATNPTAAALDLKFIAEKFRRVILIAGGSDKALPMGQFAKTIRKFSYHTILLPGSATEKLKKLIGFPKNKKVNETRSMKKALRHAQKIAKSGDAVLLSPGAASFGLFRHEFHRGNEFTKAVKQLTHHRE